MKILSYIIVGFLFALALMLNTTSFKGQFWEQASEQSYAIADTKYDYVITYEISDIEEVFNVKDYENGDVIKIVNNDQIIYYRAYREAPIDLEKWQDPIFWTQLAVNMTVVIVLYFLYLIEEENKKLNEQREDDKEWVNPFDEQYNKLFAREASLTDKRLYFEKYLAMIVNTADKIDLYNDRLKKHKRWVYRFRFLYIRKWRSWLKKIQAEIDDYNKYKSALYDLNVKLIEKAKVDFDLPIKHKEITYDTIFDRIDTRTSKTISLSWNRSHENKKRTLKASRSVVFSILLPIVVLTNVSATWGDWRSILIISLTLISASLLKIRRAKLDGIEVMNTQLKHLEKTNSTIDMFDKLGPSQFVLLDQLAYQEEVEPKKEETPKPKVNPQEESVEDKYGKDPLGLVTTSLAIEKKMALVKQQ